MGKVLIVLVVAIAAALYFDGSRAVIVERARPALDRYFVMSTRSEMDKIIQDLLAYQRDNMNQLPDRREFPDWLERQYSPGADTDSWGNRYQYNVGRETYELRSAGPDGLMGTEDDILSVQTLLRAR